MYYGISCKLTPLWSLYSLKLKIANILNMKKEKIFIKKPLSKLLSDYINL